MLECQLCTKRGICPREDRDDMEYCDCYAPPQGLKSRTPEDHARFKTWLQQKLALPKVEPAIDWDKVEETRKHCEETERE